MTCVDATLMSIVCLIQLYLLVLQLQQTDTPSSVSKISLVTIGWQAILDAYVCLAHLTTGIIAQSLFTAFATVAILKLVLFSVFEMRYLLLIWKARHPEEFATGWLPMRRQLTILYVSYVCVCMGMGMFFREFLLPHLISLPPYPCVRVGV